MSFSLSHAIGPTSLSLIEGTIGRHFEATAARFAQREALVSRHQGQRFTYAELNREADRLASALLRAGLASGDRVGIWAHNCSKRLLMQIATAKAGIVPTEHQFHVAPMRHSTVTDWARFLGLCVRITSPREVSVHQTSQCALPRTITVIRQSRSLQDREECVDT